MFIHVQHHENLRWLNNGFVAWKPSPILPDPGVECVPLQAAVFSDLVGQNRAAKVEISVPKTKHADVKPWLPTICSTAARESLDPILSRLIQTHHTKPPELRDRRDNLKTWHIVHGFQRLDATSGPPSSVVYILLSWTPKQMRDILEAQVLVPSNSANRQ